MRHGGYSAAIFAFKFAWTFVLPFILATVAQIDTSGRLVATLNFVIGAGLAAGPLLAGLMLDAGGTMRVLFGRDGRRDRVVRRVAPHRSPHAPFHFHPTVTGHAHP